MFIILCGSQIFSNPVQILALLFCFYANGKSLSAMYVCMYVCTGGCMYVCIYVCMYVCMWGVTNSNFSIALILHNKSKLYHITNKITTNAVYNFFTATKS